MAYYNPAAQGEPQVQYPAPIVYYAAPPITNQPVGTKNFGQHYDKQASIGLGACKIVLGCISITAGGLALAYYAGLNYIGIGIWAGILYLISGALAIAAGKEPMNSLITATLVFSVFDILLGVGQITVASFGVMETLYCDPYNYYSHNDYYCTNWYWGAVAANSMMIGVAAFEIIFGITMMAICGAAIDKASKVQCASIPVAYAHQQQPETVFIQGPSAFQPQPQQPPLYYVQQQYPSTSNPPQMMYVGVHEAPLTTIKF